MPLTKIIALSMIFVGLGIVAGYLFIAYLASSKPNAGLRVETKPEALVFVNGTQVGKTPFSHEYPPGEVNLKVVPISLNQQLSVYQTKIKLTDKVFTVVRREFSSNDADTVGETITLQHQPGNASLSVVSTPDVSSVTLDGQYVGPTSLYLPTIFPGDHLIVVSAPGFSPHTLTAQAVLGYKLTISVKLAGQAVNPPPIQIPLLSEASGPAVPLASTFSGTLNPTLLPETLTKPYVKILSTPTGFLRVRSGPGKNFDEISHLNPGDTFPFISSQNSWYEIRLSKPASSSGWISSDYAQLYK